METINSLKIKGFPLVKELSEIIKPLWEEFANDPRTTDVGNKDMTYIVRRVIALYIMDNNSDLGERDSLDQIMDGSFDTCTNLQEAEEYIAMMMYGETQTLKEFSYKFIKICYFGMDESWYS